MYCEVLKNVGFCVCDDSWTFNVLKLWGKFCFTMAEVEVPKEKKY